MIGIELKLPIRDQTLIAARDNGLLINVTRGKIIRVLPPLTIDEREVEMIVSGKSGGESGLKSISVVISTHHDAYFTVLDCVDQAMLGSVPA